MSDTTEAMLTAERNHSSTLLSTSLHGDMLSNGLTQPSSPKQNGHTKNNSDVHHSNGHSAPNGNVFNSEVYVQTMVDFM